MSREPVLRILFVCTGNTCRSPLAAAALAAELGEEGDRIAISSAGTSAWEGQPASLGSREVAGRDGIDLDSHRSTRLTADAVDAADLVFVMDSQHRVAVEALGAPRERVHLISEWPEPGESGLPVSDPFGASREAYEECWRRIRRHARRIAPHVLQAMRARA